MTPTQVPPARPPASSPFVSFFLHPLAPSFIHDASFVMSSLVPKHSSDDHHIPLAEIASIFYDEETRPFRFGGLTFEELPQVTQTFLTNNTERLPASLSQEELSQYFQILLAFRESQQERLARTLEGVHRAIVTGMLAAKTAEHSQDALDQLRNVLIPEWRSHLDDYVDRIDALIWFEMEMRKDTTFDMRPQHYLQERKEDVQRMIQFAVQSLQNVNETVKREVRGEMLLKELDLDLDLDLDAEDGQEPEGHISDDSGSSASSSSGDEYEESMFSDSDFDYGCSSDSEAPWINFDSTFNRIVS